MVSKGKAKVKCPTKCVPHEHAAPAKLTSHVISKMLEAIECGASIHTAAHSVGISDASAYDWIRRGENRSERKNAPWYTSFAKRVRKAQADAQLKAMRTVCDAMPKSWQAAAWFLERSDPEHWALRTRTEITGKDGGAIDIDLRTMTDEQLERIASGDGNSARKPSSC